MLVGINNKVLIIGLGLLGGSYAMGLKKYGFHVEAITKEQEDIDYAIQKGLIDYGTTAVEKEMVEKADLVIFALYPSTFIKWVEEYGSYFKPGTLITDVTGVKSSVVYKVQELLGNDVEFIAAHPMAGKEVYGVRYSDSSMFTNANYIVTPTDRNTDEAIEDCKELGKLLGFKNIAVLSPEEHDDMIGFVSQLTHCIAISLMTCSDQENLEQYTGDSFRDLTRIAKINDLMWSELFVTNKEALIRQMDLFMNKFNELKEMIANDDVDNMREMMRLSTARRIKFDKK